MSQNKKSRRHANATSDLPRADCPANHQFFSYDFAPQSDSAVGTYTWAGGASSATCSLSVSFSLAGYWNSTSSFNAFGKGTFTILAGDEWDHSMIEYFSMMTLQHS